MLPRCFSPVSGRRHVGCSHGAAGPSRAWQIRKNRIGCRALHGLDQCIHRAASVSGPGSIGCQGERDALDLNRIGQISLPVSDPDRSEAFYAQVIGLRKLYRFGDLVFFDCAGVRLMLDKVHPPNQLVPRGCIYFAASTSP